MSDEWQFSDFRYSRSRGLERRGARIHLQPKVRRLLEILLAADGNVVEKARLGELIWPGEAFSDDSLSRCVSLLRQALRGEEQEDPIKTLYGTGIRLASVPRRVRGVSEPPVVRGDPASEMIRTAFEQLAPRTEKALALGRATIHFATERHPDSVTSWLLLADIAGVQVLRNYVSAEDASETITIAAERARALDPNNDQAGAILAWSEAILRGRRVARLPIAGRPEPSGRTWITFYYEAWIEAAAGDLEAAMALVDLGLIQSPLEYGLLGQKVWLLICIGRLDAADALAVESLSLRPDIDTLVMLRAIIATLRGDFERARRLSDEAVARTGDDSYLIAYSGWVDATAGRPGVARERLARLHGRRASETHVAAALLALGDEAAARDGLASALRNHCPWAALAWCDPRLRALKPARPARG